jgi:ribonuclease HI
VKINTDGAFQAETLMGAIGVVIRDEHGVFLKAMTRKLPSIGSVLMAEVEAWRDGLRLLGLVPQQKVILESDSLELIDLWGSRDDYRSKVHPILHDIQAMTSLFHHFRCSI